MAQKPTLSLPQQAELEALRKIVAAVRQDRENYVCGPASKAALAEYDALKR